MVACKDDISASAIVCLGYPLKVCLCSLSFYMHILLSWYMKYFSGCLFFISKYLVWMLTGFALSVNLTLTGIVFGILACFIKMLPTSNNETGS